MRKRRRSDLELIGDTVGQVLSRFEPAPGITELVAAWPAAVGPAIARNAWPERLARDGTLNVATSSSAWAFELTHLEPSVLGKLRNKVGTDVAIARLRFAPGRLPEPSPEEVAESRPSPPVVEEATKARAEVLSAGIESAELRELVARAAAASLSHQGDARDAEFRGPEAGS